MPRPLVFGNGSLLVAMDDRYRIRDLFYPHVGLSNHLSAHSIRMGVWVEGSFSWIEDAGWTRRMEFFPRTLVGHSILEHAAMGIRIEAEEAVSPRSNEFLRRWKVTNLASQEREIRIFASHDLRIMETDIGDTAFYNPFLDGIVHFKGPTFFLFGGSTSLGGLYEYATGIKGFGGLEGTWRDAEDGRLGMNPIAQGSVDSTMSLRMRIPGGQTRTAHYWIVADSSLESLTSSYHEMVHKGFDSMLLDAHQYWHAYSSQTKAFLCDCEEGPGRLPPELVDFACQSVLIMRTQIDNAGAILAANDSDIMATNRANYSYMWPRDGAFVSTIFDRMGYHEIPRRFFRFCQKILPKGRPILFQKYRSDGSLGATWHPWVVDGRPEIPFQEDETALTILAIWDHFRLEGGIEFLSELYDDFVVPAADFIVRYRDPASALPLPSYDLWEERRGVHTFTTAAVIAGLRAAASIAAALNDERSSSYAQAADETLAGLRTCLFDSRRGVFYRRLVPGSNGDDVPDTNVDSATLQVGLLGILPPDDPMVVSNLQVIERELTIKSPVGGLGRYQDDYYFRQSYDVPGNPWIICTMWLAQAKIQAAEKREDLEEPLHWLRWVLKHAARSGVLPEQLHPITGEHLSVSPLTWSHAEVVKTILDYCDKVRRLGK
ncbi:MAG: glycoside hydrolase family 15 protein [Fimbriimonadaceae bacterium]